MTTIEGHLPTDDISALEALLDRLRAVYDELRQLNGGVAVLHTEAAIAALESRLRSQRAAVD